MKTSARNQLAGTIARVTSGAVNDEIELALKGGQRIVATVTGESTAGLKLSVGGAAFTAIWRSGRAAA